MVIRPSLMYRHAACVLDLDTGNRFQLPPSFAPNRQNSIDISNCLRQLLPPFQPSPLGVDSSTFQIIADDDDNDGDGDGINNADGGGSDGDGDDHNYDGNNGKPPDLGISDRALGAISGPSGCLEHLLDCLEARLGHFGDLTGASPAVLCRYRALLRPLDASKKTRATHVLNNATP